MPSDERISLDCVLHHLERVTRPYRDERGRTRYAHDSVEVLAERAKLSTRTVYRVLAREYPDAIEVDLADRLLLAAGAMLYDCEDVG